MHEGEFCVKGIVLSVAVLFLTLLTTSTYAQNSDERYNEDGLPVKRFIVAVDSGDSSQLGVQSLTKQYNVSAVADELYENVHGVDGVKELRKEGFVIVEGDERNILDALDKMSGVRFVEEDHRISISSSTNQPALRETVNTWLNSDLSLNSTDAAVDAANVNNAPDCSSGCVSVAVIDTGAKVTHDYIENVVVSFTSGNDIVNSGASSMTDPHGHGTHVSSLVKSIRDQAMTMGYTNASKIRILPIRVMDANGDGFLSDLVTGISRARTLGAKVINLSLGGPSFSNSMYEAIRDAYNTDDVFFAIAAGNSNQNLDSTSSYPASFSTEIPGVISVGSHIAGSSTRSSFSNYGAGTVDVFAPGSPTSGITGAGITSDTAFVGMQGTSMATPIVAGIAAVIRNIKPALNAYEIKNLITGNVSGTHSLFRFGKVNAKAAFDAAVSATASGTKPSAPAASSFSVSSAGSTSSGGGGAPGTDSSSGGCMSLSVGNSHSSSGGSGPFGGNSLGLFAAFYFVFQFLRQARRKQSQNRL